jgi:hypothetical protein
MLKYLIQNSDFSSLLQLLSPQFMEVISPVELLKIAQNLKSGYHRDSHWNKEISQLSASLPPVWRMTVAPESPPRSHERLAHPWETETEASLNRVLQLFFHQILTRPMWVLDFRPQMFLFDASEAPAEPLSLLHWSPAPVRYTPSSEFLTQIRALYQGFYEDQPALFDQALATLGLTPAKDVLLEHFGLEGQRRVPFHLKTFQKTFAKVFQSCAKAHSRIHPEFAVLGFMLITLYETLELSHREFDVRQAYFAAAQERETSPSAASPAIQPSAEEVRRVGKRLSVF